MAKYYIKNGLGETSKSTHPLDEQEILRLLQCAHHASERGEISTILVRLWQACQFWQAAWSPSGDVAQAALDKRFWRLINGKEIPTQEIANEILQLIEASW